ncbi:hypothetical protein LI012_13400, partial [Caldibacillus thermoamylovorans]|nr:hypothetical protein [Caldibacillus thermoamylovorans]
MSCLPISLYVALQNSAMIQLYEGKFLLFQFAGCSEKNANYCFRSLVKDAYFLEFRNLRKPVTHLVAIWTRTRRNLFWNPKRKFFFYKENSAIAQPLGDGKAVVSENTFSLA